MPDDVAAFQSTRPVRGGTIWRVTSALCWKISIHPPRAGRDLGVPPKIAAKRISIHPPRAGRDDILFFLANGLIISIHPPRAGRDG